MTCARPTVEEFRFHLGLAQLAGNALLDLFLRIIVELFRRHWSSTGQALPTWADVVAVEHAHLRILRGDRRPATTAWPATASVVIWTPRPPGGCSGGLSEVRVCDLAWM